MPGHIKDLPPGVGVCKTISGRGRQYWRVRLGKRFTGGTVILKDFGKLDDARKWIFGEAQGDRANPGAILDIKEKAGTSVFQVTAAQLYEAVGAIKELEKAGLTLAEAVQFAVRHARPPGGIIPVKVAMERALAVKRRSRRPTYVSNLRSRWARFERWLPADKKKAINTITRLDVRRFLNELNLSPVGELNMLRNVSVLFSWAVNQQHVAENPCLGIKVEESSVRRTGARILSIEEARKLLFLAAEGFKVEAEEEEKDHWRKKFGAVSLTVPPLDLIPIMVVGCFAGVRPAESDRMTWEMIDFKRKHIDLPAEITKDGDRRIIDMSDNLLEWLLACRRDSGRLFPENYRRKRWALSRAMNWKEWPDDILRHSYGSYHLAQHRNAALTAEQMGHKNVRMLYAHYREVVKDAEDVTAYWNLRPSHAPSIVEFAA